MHVRLRQSVIGILGFLALSGFGSVSGNADLPKPVEKKPINTKVIEDDRSAIGEMLMERVSIAKIEGLTPQETVERLTELLDIPILLDLAGGEELANAAQFQNATITIPGMKNVRKETILLLFAKQMRSTYMIFPDHIKIVSYATAQEIIQIKTPQNEDEANFPAAEAALLRTKLVNVNLVNLPLSSALKEVERRSGWNIILAPQAAVQAGTVVNAQFSNTPVERALETLAEMAELKVVKKGNVLLVTTPERALPFGARQTIGKQ